MGQKGLAVHLGSEISGNARENPAQEADSCCQCKCYGALFLEPREIHFALENLVQNDESEHRQRHLKCDQCH